MGKIEVEIASRIKEMMARRNINQTNLAKELGVHQYDISRMLNGKPFPTIEQLIIIAKYLDCSLYYLIGEQEESYRELSPKVRLIANKYSSANETIQNVVDLILINSK